LQILVTLASFPRALLAAGFMVARGDTRPGGQVAVRWEAAHIHADLSDDQNGQMAVYAWDGIQQAHRMFKRGHLGELPFNPLLDLLDLLVKEIKLC